MRVLHHYQPFEEVQARLQTFLEDVYNAKRLHSSLGCETPNEFEAEYLTQELLEKWYGFPGGTPQYGCQHGCHGTGIA